MLKKKMKAGSPMIKSLAALTLLVGASIASADPIVANLEDATNGGGFFATVTMANTPTVGTVRVTADVDISANGVLSEGDILGLWLDITPESLLSGMTYGNDDPANIVSVAVFGPANSVNAVGGANNDVSPAGSNWDIGFAFSANGCGDGCFQTISFDLTSTNLTSAAFENQRVGMRVQSITGDWATGGSSKLIGIGEDGGDTTSGDTTQVPLPGTLLLLGLGLLGLGHTRRKAV